MFYIVDNKKTVKLIEKIDTGLKIWYTDNTHEEIALSLDGNGNGDSSIEIPKHVSSIKEDIMNDGIGVTYSDGEYERVYVKNTPTIAKSIKLLNIDTKGQILLTLNNFNLVTKTTPYIYNVELDTAKGELIYYHGNNTIKSINIKDYISSLITPITTYNNEIYIHYYKIEDNNKIEITEEEFNNLQCITKYFKEVDGKMIEITEEEFNSL